MPVFNFDGTEDVLELEGVPAEMLTIGSTPDHAFTVLALSDGASAWRVYLADRQQTRFLIQKLQARLEEMWVTP